MGINEKAWHVGFKWTIGNEDVPAGAIAIDNTSKQLHICDIADANKDWNVPVGVDPALYIHCYDTNAATDYIKLYHDDTTGIYDTDGTTVFTTTSTAFTVALAATLSSTLAVTGVATFSDDIVATTSTGADVNVNGIQETLTVSGNCTGSVCGIRVKAECDSTARTIGNFYGANFDARLVNTSDALSGIMAGLQVAVSLGACTTGSLWVYGINIDLSEAGGARATAIKAFIDFQDYDSGGSFPCQHLFDVGGSGSRCSTGTSGDIEYNETLHILVNTGNRYIPLSTVEGTYTTAYPVSLTHASTPLAITSTMASTTGQDLATFTVTDSSVLASDYNRAIYINWTSTGAKSGGYINPISIDFNAITDLCGAEVALECLYITQTGDKLDSNVFAWQVYCEDLGTAVGNVEMLDMGRVMTNAATTGRDGFIRAKGHGGTCASILYCEGTSDALATQFAIFSGCSGATQLFVDGINVGSGYTCAAVLRATYEGTPGTTTTQYYIPLYTAD